MISKRKVKKITSSTGVEISEIYCRRCMKTKKFSDFYTSVDNELDRNGYLSICSDCCNEIYNNAYRAEKNVPKAILRACRILNIKFDENAVSATQTHLETLAKNGKETTKVIGIYKSQVVKTEKSNPFDKNETFADLTFHEVSGAILEPTDPLEDHEKNSVELKQFWGEKFEYDEYVWLEAEYSNWKATNPPSNRNEETILKLVVLKLLSIRKEINAGKDTSKLEEGLTKLLNTGALSPIQSNAVNQGKSNKLLGVTIEDLERIGPADWWKDNSIYKNIDDIDGYWKIHILRPFLNFWGVQKDFNFEGAVESESDDIEDNNLGET